MALPKKSTKKKSTKPGAKSPAAQKPGPKAQQIESALSLMKIAQSSRSALISWPAHRRHKAFEFVQEVWYAALNEKRRRARNRQLYGHSASDVTGDEKDPGLHGEHEEHVKALRAAIDSAIEWAHENIGWKMDDEPNSGFPLLNDHRLIAALPHLETARDNLSKTPTGGMGVYQGEYAPLARGRPKINLIVDSISDKPVGRKEIRLALWRKLTGLKGEPSASDVGKAKQAQKLARGLADPILKTIPVKVTIG